jgi:hypothetical protein
MAWDSAFLLEFGGHTDAWQEPRSRLRSDSCRQRLEEPWTRMLSEGMNRRERGESAAMDSEWLTD